MNRLNVTEKLLPLERWLELNSFDADLFPYRNTSYFSRYIGIKNYMKKHIYNFIGSATSVEDKGIFTDHGPDHFDAVIQHAGKLLGVPSKPDSNTQLAINPYEGFVLLVAILLHDAGNILGRAGHEKQAIAIFLGMGDGLCDDQFEANLIANIAQAHGGYVRIPSDDKCSKDTIGQTLLEEDTMFGVTVRQKYLAALVRFADEICEDRNRAARFLAKNSALPEHSQVYHAYAEAISSVEVDLKGKCIRLKLELMKEKMMQRFGKGASNSIKKVYLIEEIFVRLEKMYSEMIYCQRFMGEHIPINRVVAKLFIYKGEKMEVVKQKDFELKEEGYPDISNCLIKRHPDWKGTKLKKLLKSE